MNPQALMDGLVAGSMIGLGAVGVTLTYSILRFANFAHGEFIAWGAYFALVVAGALGALSGSLSAPIGPFSFGWALVIAALVAVALNGGLALLVDAAALRPPALAEKHRHHHGHGELRRGADAAQPARIHLHLAAALFLQGVADRHCRSAAASAPRPTSCCRSPSPPCWSSPCICFCRAPRSAAPCAPSSENPQLAGVAGVEVRRVIRIVWLLGAALACIAGISAGLLVQIRPQMGLDLLLPLFAAAILGGIGSVPGAMLAGLIVGLSEAFAVQLVGAEWRAAVAFVILVLVLLLRPQGLFGRAE